MTVAEIIGARIKQRGITKAELSRRIKLNPDLLDRSLKGERKIKANEFLALCKELELDLSDFEAVEK